MIDCKIHGFCSTTGRGYRKTLGESNGYLGIKHYDVIITLSMR